jgi:hypothetical protein
MHIEIKEKAPDATQTVVDIADDINKKRRKEIIETFENRKILSYLHTLREQGTYIKGNKSKTMRLIAHIPIEVDIFFERIYGKEYYKDDKFFKEYPEWLTIPLNQL